MSATTAVEKIPAGTYKADPVHSTIHFSVVHNGVSAFRSGFRDYEATLEGGAEPGLTGTVDVASIDIGDEMLKGHLLSPEFFDTERHPQLRFTSTSLELGEENELGLRGELEIGGVTHAVAANGLLRQLGNDLAGNARVGISLETSVDRRDFGLDWQAELPSGGEVIDYEVRIAVELELVAEGE